MNAKKIASILLLLFVAGSIGAIVAKETGSRPVPTADEKITQPMPPTQNTAATTQTDVASPVKVIAYYFHGNYRCPTCRSIEAYTTEAINNGFAEDLKNGRVELKVVNVEEPNNEHFIQDYQLANRSVVLARYEGNNQKDWKRLDEVWQLVSDKDSFVRFVQDQTTALLKGN